MVRPSAPGLRAFLFSLAGLLAGVSVAELPGPPVVVASPELQAIYREVEVTGSVTSPRVAQLSAATSGLVQTLLAEEGDRVEQGQVLLKLDPELAELESRSAQARVSQAQAALGDARRRLEEARRLGPSGGLPQTQILDLAAEVEQDETLLQQAKADAGLREALLRRHTLTAPFAGVISERGVELGEWLTPGESVFELVATDDLRLDFAVAEDFATALSLDTPVQLTLNALPGEQFKGVIQTLVPVAEPGARTLLLRVGLDTAQQQDTRLMPGMSARARLRIPAQRSGLVIPRDALLRYPDGRVVVWKLSDGDSGAVVYELAVRTGQVFGDRVEIVEGLGPGDEIVVRGNESLRNGQRVHIRGRGEP